MIRKINGRITAIEHMKNAAECINDRFDVLHCSIRAPCPKSAMGRL